MRVALSGTLIALIAATLAACDPQPQASPPGEAAAEEPAAFPPAQHYQLKDPRGRTVDLREFRGKVVLVNFWATWCPPCRYEIPYLVELRKAYPQDKVAIIGVSLDQGDHEQVAPLLTRFVDHFKINYPIVHDGQFELIRQFHRGDLRALGVPMTFLFDRQGKLRQVHEGVPSGSGASDPGKILAADLDLLLGR
ncbi:MAG: TlpA disulfide reductase family protein [Candidatus Latescibacterota bacterium]